MADPPFDAQQAHRWFAVEFNNQAWELVEAAQRSPDQTEQMIDLAHATAIHWRQVGTLINQLRAQCLLATAYAAAGLGEAAVRHAERCLASCREAGNEQTAWDRATAHGSAANAYACVGDLVRAHEQHRQAIAAAASFDDPDGQPLFQRLFPRPPNGS
jgi:hypothetical protein